ncbi:helix-turn-helix transcriptional regulator [Sporolactobacillus sp. CQH2019]|uniref:helix-turn-helix transcriptional regulator n=1 Tax=Sporolactobacillus sp. CQH2019 TaxID=3023512 RepID=UPI00236804FD|nr:helix-turn-helix transcriptional regulator [Sporolactobacillus sp. CQH2019]MDD9148127.1 helix-turn-helix transcriptional regulator [Sporolactobacillus sp. CQH2019]
MDTPIINSNKLKAKMVLAGYNRKTLAEATGLDRNTIGLIISGKTSPSFRAMNLIYHALKLNPQEATEIFFVRNLRNTKVRKG